MERLEPPERRVEVVAAVAQALPRAGHEQLQVGARVRVEGREDLVRVHVGRGGAHPDAPAVGDHAAGARVDLQEHVLERRLRAQERRGVLAHHVLVGVLDVELHDRPAVLEPDAADLADLDTGHAHGLPAAGLHRLRVRELDLDPLRRVIHEREPEALLGEDHHGGGHADHQHAEDRQEVEQMGADRALHGADQRVAGPPGAASAGGSWVSQATSGRCTGGVFASNGAAGSILPVARFDGITPWMWKTCEFAS